MLLVDVVAFTWFAFFAIVYGAAFLAGWSLSISQAFLGLFLVGGPFTFGVLHRRVRIEASRAPDALYRKRLLTDR